MSSPNLSVTDGASGLRIEHLRKSYRKKTVIRDFSMELNRGEVVALLGPNGSGKTTTFYAVAGLVMPEGGTLLIFMSGEIEHRVRTTHAERQCIVGWFRESEDGRVPDEDSLSLRTLGAGGWELGPE